MYKNLKFRIVQLSLKRMNVHILIYAVYIIRLSCDKVDMSL